MDSANDGAILFSMGSMLEAVSMPIEKLKIFQEFFAKLPQKVIWKWENENMIDKPDNVKIVKWMPQLDILRKLPVIIFIIKIIFTEIYELLKTISKYLFFNITPIFFYNTICHFQATKMSYYS